MDRQRQRYVRYMDDFVIIAPTRHKLLRVDAASLRNFVGFTSRRLIAIASGGMRSVGVAGEGLRLDGLVSLKGGRRRVVIRQLRILGTWGFQSRNTRPRTTPGRCSRPQPRAKMLHLLGDYSINKCCASTGHASQQLGHLDTPNFYLIGTLVFNINWVYLINLTRHLRSHTL